MKCNFIIYPKSSKFQFKIQFDKNNQVHDLVLTPESPTPNEEIIFVESPLGRRPKDLFDHIHGRPVILATDWIDSFIEEML